MQEKELAVVQVLLTKGIIPTTGKFQITEIMLQGYLQQYHTLFGTTSKSTGGTSNVKFARRLAGRTLLAINFSRGIKSNEISAGLVYLIENPAFPEHYKVGMTIDLKSRLNSYQTYDPYRAFKVVKYDFVLDRRLKEKELLQHPNILNEQGEWVKKDFALEVFSKIIV